MKNKKSQNKGFTLLETLVAIAVFTAAIVGPVSLVSYSIQKASSARNEAVAYYLAEEAVEYARNIRDANALERINWLNGLNNCFNSSNGCYADVINDNISQCQAGQCPKIKYNKNSGYFNYVVGEDTIFTRKISIDNNVGNRIYEAEITVEVTWPNRSLVIKDHLFDWK
ncbi:MAG: type II secretion system protein [bacterium]|nr:type II secretion system protein [bacterium]